MKVKKKKLLSEIPFLEDDLIFLRHPEEIDIPNWTSWFNDSKVTEQMNKGFFANSQRLQREFLSRGLEDEHTLQLAIVLKKGERLVGTIGLHKIDWIHRTADISILIGSKEARGKGIGKRSIDLIVGHAFLKLNLRKLTAGMWSINKGSEKIFKNCGFKLEGKLKKQFFYKNRYVDSLYFAIHKNDWLSNIKK